MVLKRLDAAKDLAGDPAVRAGRARVLQGAARLAVNQADFAAALELADACRELWEELGDREGVAQSLITLGSVALWRSQPELSEARFEEALVIWRALKNPEGIAYALNCLGPAVYDQGQTDRARDCFTETLAIARSRADKGAISAAINNLGILERDSKNLAAARAYYEEGLAIFEELGDRGGTAIGLNNLGEIHRDLGEFLQARARHREALAPYRELGNDHGLAWSLEGIALGLIGDEGAGVADQADRALRLIGAAEAPREAIGSPLNAERRSEYAPFRARARALLGGDAADAALAAGRTLPLDQALELAAND